jgi:hypothetical protein
MDGSCDNDFLTLGLNGGALDLIAFENGQGILTSVYPTQLTYVVVNGPLASIITSAVIDSDFEVDVIEAIESPQTVTGGSRLRVYSSTTNVDKAENLFFFFSYNIYPCY